MREIFFILGIILLAPIVISAIILPILLFILMCVPSLAMPMVVTGLIGIILLFLSGELT